MKNIQLEFRLEFRKIVDKFANILTNNMVMGRSLATPEAAQVMNDFLKPLYQGGILMKNGILQFYTFPLVFDRDHQSQHLVLNLVFDHGAYGLQMFDDGTIIGIQPVNFSDSSWRQFLLTNQLVLKNMVNHSNRLNCKIIDNRGVQLTPERIIDSMAYFTMATDIKAWQILRFNLLDVLKTDAVENLVFKGVDLQTWQFTCGGTNAYTQQIVQSCSEFFNQVIIATHRLLCAASTSNEQMANHTQPGLPVN